MIANKERGGAVSAVSDKLQIVREDIRYISSELGRSGKTPLHSKKYFWVIEGIPVYFWVLLLTAGVIRRKFIEPMYPETAKKKAINNLAKEAGKYAKAGNYSDVYRKIEEISKKIGEKINEFLDNLGKEIDMLKDFFYKKGYKPLFKKVHLGGGSPSMMNEEEFRERMEIGDKFLYGIFEGKHVKVVDDIIADLK